jgi:transposase-like protein
LQCILKTVKHMKKLDQKHQQNVIYIIMHAKEIFTKLRWPNGVRCPYCGEVHCWTYKNGMHKCSKCGKRFSDTSNTVFHGTKIPIASWIVALYLITMSKGCSSEELSAYTGITQKSAWFLLHKVREAFRPDGTVLDGDVAVDEVYLGGKWSSIILPKKIDILKRYGLWYEGDKERTWHKKNIRRAISEYKQPVYGMNDGKNIVLMAVPNRFDSKDLLDITLKHTGNIQHLVSDQSILYKEIAETGIDVIQMNHSKREFHNGEYSSNRIEGTFSHLKRRYRCHYVRPEKKYIQLYLNEFCFRWNHRDNTSIERLADSIGLCVTRGRVTNKDIYNYNWLSSYHQRKPKRRETLEEWFEIGWPPYAESMEVQGVVYTKERFNELKAQWEAKRDIWHIDESELVF